MSHLDYTRQSPEIAALLLMRGTALPPVRWHEHPLPTATAALEQLSDEKLFGSAPLQNPAGVSAVRGLLLLLNGWLSEAAMVAAAAPTPERWYIAGLSERHLGHGEASKSHLRQVEGHPIFAPLAVRTAELGQQADDKSLRRFVDIVAMNGAFEPFAFTDLLAEAGEGRLSRDAEMIARKLQRQEFLLLLAHCYQLTTGLDPAQARTEANNTPAAPPRRRRETTRPTQHLSAPPTSTPRPTPPPPVDDHKVRIGCPKCHHVAVLDVEQRGSKHRCNQCSTVFRVPGGAASNAAGDAAASTSSAGHSHAGSASEQVRCACPKCRAIGVYPPAARGHGVRCGKCGASFRIPDQRAA